MLLGPAEDAGDHIRRPCRALDAPTSAPIPPSDAGTGIGATADPMRPSAAGARSRARTLRASRPRWWRSWWTVGVRPGRLPAGRATMRAGGRPRAGLSDPAQAAALRTVLASGAVVQDQAVCWTGVSACPHCAQSWGEKEGTSRWRYMPFCSCCSVDELRIRTCLCARERLAIAWGDQPAAIIAACAGTRWLPDQIALSSGGLSAGARPRTGGKEPPVWRSSGSLLETKASIVGGPPLPIGGFLLVGGGDFGRPKVVVQELTHRGGGKDELAVSDAARDCHRATVLRALEGVWSSLGCGPL